MTFLPAFTAEQKAQIRLWRDILLVAASLLSVVALIALLLPRV